MAAAVKPHEGAGARVIGAITFRTIAVTLRHGVGVAVVKWTERCSRDGACGCDRAGGDAGSRADGAVVAIISAALIGPAIAPAIIGRPIALIVRARPALITKSM